MINAKMIAISYIIYNAYIMYIMLSWEEKRKEN